MWETLYSGEEVEIDIVKGEDFEQVWTFYDENNVPIPFITQGWGVKAAICDRTGKIWIEDMTATSADDGSITVFLGRAKTSLLAVGVHVWTLTLIEPGTGYYNVVFNPPARIHAGAVKS